MKDTRAFSHLYTSRIFAGRTIVMAVIFIFTKRFIQKYFDLLNLFE